MITLTFARKTDLNETHSCWAERVSYSEKYQEYYCVRDNSSLVWDAKEWILVEVK